METLHLRWDEYEPNVKNGFSQLRADEDFYDVTLACGDNHIKAHKVILGTCSSFFKSLLKAVSHHHPLLYLGGIEFTYLESILLFMYHGEVSIKSEELDNFLAVAQELKVNGLMHNSSPPKTEDRLRESHHFKSDTPNKKVKRESSSEIFVPDQKKVCIPKHEDSDIEILTPIEPNNCVQTQSNEELEYGNRENNYQDELEEGDSTNTSIDKMEQINEVLNDRISKFISPRNFEKKYDCMKCSYSSIKRVDVQRHIESRHIITNGFPCDKCGGRYKTRCSLGQHKVRAHKGDPEFVSTVDL